MWRGHNKTSEDFSRGERLGVVSKRSLDTGNAKHVMLVINHARTGDTYMRAGQHMQARYVYRMRLKEQQ